MKKISKLLTALVVTAMMFSFFGSSVFAATSVSSAPTIVKSITEPDSSKLTDDDTYEFTMTYTGKSNVGTNEAVDPTGVGVGDTQTLTLKGKATSPLVSGQNQDSLTKYVFTTPGMYDFTIQETNVSNAHVDKDSNTYTLRAVVTYGENTANGATDFNTLNVAWYDGNTDDKKPLGNDGFTIYNNMKGEGNYAIVTINKIVKGNSADPNDTFTIPVTVNGINGVTYTVVAPEGNPDTITAGQTAEFTLKGGDSIQIAGLLVGTDTVSVSETLPTNSLYKKTFTYNNGSYTEGTAQAITTTGNNVFDITNTCNNSFTGYVTTILPYAIIAVIAVAGIVIVRKRRAA